MNKTASLFTVGISTLLWASSSAQAQTTVTNQPNSNYYDPYELNDGLGQITSVDSLRDIAPTNWAYEALRNLVDRYGCIAGFPDQTYRGNQALSRYEFAAGLNSCLNQIERLIASNENIANEDLMTLQRLQQDFTEELKTFGSRIDNLSSRTAALEESQFSTTTKLNGEVIFSFTGATGGDPDAGNDPEIIFNDRVRLNLNTSFSGSDLLITGLQAQNFGGELDGSGSTQGALFPNDAFLTAGNAKLNFEPQFPRFTPQDISEENESNSVNLYKLLYIFPSGLDKLTLFAGTTAEVSDAFPTIIPFADEGQGAVSRFAGLNPVLRISGGTSQIGLASATGFIWNISETIDWRALYASVSAAIADEGDANILGAGFFDGSVVAATQLTLKPVDTVDIGLNYAYSFHELNILATGLSRVSATPLNIPEQTVNADGSINIGGIVDTSIGIHSVGTSVNWNVLPQVSLTAYGAYFFVDSRTGDDASSEFLSWMTGIHVKDLLTEGNTAGLIFGQPLNRVDAGGAAELTEPDVDRAIPYHLEAFFNYKISNNLSITPGGFILFNPEGDENNDTTAVGVLRTTFSF
ncbi:MAG: iron uptake porin [Cyanobacteria bacterium P01_A01_bin.40]